MFGKIAETGKQRGRWTGRQADPVMEPSAPRQTLREVQPRNSLCPTPTEQRESRVPAPGLLGTSDHPGQGPKMCM